MVCTKCISINYRWCRCWCAHCLSQYFPSLRITPTKAVTPFLFFLFLFLFCPFQHYMHTAWCFQTPSNWHLSTSQKYFWICSPFYSASHILDLRDFQKHCPTSLALPMCLQSYLRGGILGSLRRSNLKCVSLAQPSCRRAKCETTNSHLSQRIDFSSVQQTERKVCSRVPERGRICTYQVRCSGMTFGNAKLLVNFFLLLLLLQVCAAALQEHQVICGANFTHRIYIYPLTCIQSCI